MPPARRPQALDFRIDDNIMMFAYAKPHPKAVGDIVDVVASGSSAGKPLAVQITKILERPGVPNVYYAETYEQMLPFKR